MLRLLEFLLRYLDPIQNQYAHAESHESQRLKVAACLMQTADGQIPLCLTFSPHQ